MLSGVAKVFDVTRQSHRPCPVSLAVPVMGYHGQRACRQSPIGEGMDGTVTDYGRSARWSRVREGIVGIASQLREGQTRVTAECWGRRASRRWAFGRPRGYRLRGRRGVGRGNRGNSSGATGC